MTGGCDGCGGCGTSRNLDNLVELSETDTLASEGFNPESQHNWNQKMWYRETIPRPDSELGVIISVVCIGGVVVLCFFGLAVNSHLKSNALKKNYEQYKQLYSEVLSVERDIRWEKDEYYKHKKIQKRNELQRKRDKAWNKICEFDTDGMFVKYLKNNHKPYSSCNRR